MSECIIQLLDYTNFLNFKIPEILLTLLLLLSLVRGGVAGGAPLVVAVVTGHNLIVLRLLLGLDLVNASCASRCNTVKVNTYFILLSVVKSDIWIEKYIFIYVRLKIRIPALKVIKEIYR